MGNKKGNRKPVTKALPQCVPCLLSLLCLTGASLYVAYCKRCGLEFGLIQEWLTYRSPAGVRFDGSAMLEAGPALGRSTPETDMPRTGPLLSAAQQCYGDRIPRYEVAVGICAHCGYFPEGGP